MRSQNEKEIIIGYSIGYCYAGEDQVDNNNNNSGTFDTCLGLLLSEGAYSLLDAEVVYYVDLHMRVGEEIISISVNIDHSNGELGQQ